MSIQSIILNRHSVRSYTGQTINKNDLTVILQAAMQAPSAMNKQPWEFIVVQNSQTLHKIISIHPYASFVQEAGTVIFCAFNKQKAFNNYGIIDISLAAENLMLSASALGYGTCFCGIDSILNDSFLKFFNMPSYYQFIGLITVGIPRQATNTPSLRYDLQKIHFDKW